MPPRLYSCSNRLLLTNLLEREAARHVQESNGQEFAGEQCSEPPVNVDDADDEGGLSDFETVSTQS